jgi:hypothetical protein
MAARSRLGLASNGQQDAERTGACASCNGERWVCENHPDREWPDVCDCGAGMPCPACNAGSPPAMPPGSVTIWSINGDGCEGEA